MEIFSRWKTPAKPVKDCGDKMRTQQHFEPECNVNNIMRKYRQTGILPQSSGKPLFGDFSGEIDYQTALNGVISAKAEFDGLPSEIRKKFKNDLNALDEYLKDPSNKEEAMKLGLLTRPVVKEPDKLDRVADLLEKSLEKKTEPLQKI